MSQAEQETKALMAELKAHAWILGGLVGLMWAIEFADLALGGRLELLGIRPLSPAGLPGIFFAPFLHAGFRHLISNTLPFLVLGWLIMARDVQEFIAVSVIAALASGIGTWLFGVPGTLHIGASGVIFGYFGYLILRAWFERSLGSIFIALVVFSLFGGMIWGILPIQIGISWQGHLFGLIGGIVAARLISWINGQAKPL
ncbi:rhomboid family intramembrane serine protease [Alkalinema sp. FACHB-956]|uniref:rhomboid family intramembrane serine protease n=1 Tax=Alkalinema sp. FACHB-956 TaxID=2692768 RepID=UPI001688AC3F|nr:rhomboid family intramembrane serine protease [Alkalinema sp. FACHB-956]MBD2329004.1 rhomboid family intramembrane serine protease [Alkalinema sp. FACHB-956]